MKYLELVRKGVSRLTCATSVLSYIGYALIILITVCDVVLRYVINTPILGAYEMVQYLLLVAVFASFAYCQTLRGHIHVTMFLMLMPRRLTFVLYTLTGILSFFTMLFVGYAASQQAVYAFTNGFTTDVLKIPTYPFIWIECICMVIFAISILVDVFYSAVAIFNEELRDKLSEEWL